MVGSCTTESLAPYDAIRGRRRCSRRRRADQGYVGVEVARRCDVRLTGEGHGPRELAGNGQVVTSSIQGAVEDLVVAGSVEQHMPQQVARWAVLRDHRRVRPRHRHVDRHRRVRVDVSRPAAGPEVAARVDVAGGVHLDGWHIPAVAGIGVDCRRPLRERPGTRRRRQAEDGHGYGGEGQAQVSNHRPSCHSSPPRVHKQFIDRVG